MSRVWTCICSKWTCPRERPAHTKSGFEVGILLDDEVVGEQCRVVAALLLPPDQGRATQLQVAIHAGTHEPDPPSGVEISALQVMADRQPVAIERDPVRVAQPRPPQVELPFYLRAAWLNSPLRLEVSTVHVLVNLKELGGQGGSCGVPQ
jgi:hypothetical protein